jgi:hypothetical protein
MFSALHLELGHGSTQSAWHYVINGARKGPVTSATIKGLFDTQVRRKGMSASKSPRQRISSGLVFKIFDMRRGFIGMQVNDLLVEAQQPHGKGGSAEYANRKSDATTAATSAASAGDASRQ